MKKLIVSLLWAGIASTVSVNAQTEIQDQSPVFEIISTETQPGSLAFSDRRDMKTENEEWTAWCLPDTVVSYKTDQAYEKYIYTLDERGNALKTEYLQYIQGVWTPMQRIDAVFNRWDEIDTTVNYYWQVTDYMPSERKISTYDDNGNRLTLLNEKWDATKEAWVGSSRYTYTYTAENLLQTSIREEYSSMTLSGWTETQKNESVYDADGNEIEYNVYMKTEGQWMPYRTLARTYQNGLMILEQAKMVNADGIYADAYKQIYQYDQNGNNIDYLYQTYDSVGWRNSVHRTMKYSSENLILEWQSAIWEQAMQDWLNQGLEKYTYNERNDLQTLLVYRWESTQWGQTSRLDYAYDENGNRTYYVREGIRFDTMRVEKYIYQNDEDGNEISGVCYRLDKKDSVWNPVALYDLAVYYADGTIAYQALNTPLHRIDIHYAKGVKSPAAEDNVPFSDLDVVTYPNPAHGAFYVRTGGDGKYVFSLMDMSGKILQKKTNTGTTTSFDLRSYSGVLLLRVEKGKQVSVRKIIAM